MSCGGKQAENRNAQIVSIVATDTQLTVATTRDVFHTVAKWGRTKEKLAGEEAWAYARRHLYAAADKRYRRLKNASCGGWHTWQWDGDFDETTATWSLTPRDPTGEPPGVDWRETYRQQAIREERLIRVAVTGDPTKGDGYLFTPSGQRIWGLHGGAGVLMRHQPDEGEPMYFLGKRAASMGAGGRWGPPGGARDLNEDDYAAGLREFGEEIGVSPLGAHPYGTFTDEVLPGEWSFTTVLVDVPDRFAVPRPGRDWETTAHAWFTPTQLAGMAERGRLHPRFAQHLARLTG